MNRIVIVFKHEFKRLFYFTQPQPKKKAKTKIGNKSKKKKKLKTTNKFPDGTEGEQEHQDYCEVCIFRISNFTLIVITSMLQWVYEMLNPGHNKEPD